MSHFAKVNENRVVNVLVAEEEFFDTYVDDSPGYWIQCSYNTSGGVHYDNETQEPSADQSKALRYNFPGIGSYYDQDSDAFYSPSPYNSWVLNTNTYLWEAPVAMPQDDNNYSWDEEASSWQLDNKEEN